MPKDFRSIALPVGVERADALPDIPPYPFFDLATHPTQWSFVEVEPGRFEWLPDLQKLPYRPGVNGAHFVAQKLPDGTERKILANLEEVRGIKREKGYNFVDREGPAGDYLHGIPCQRGLHHHAAWESYTYAEGFGARVVVDHARKVDFQRALIAHSVVSAPPEIFRQRQISEARAEVQRQAAAPKSEAQATALARANARLKAMEATPLPTAETYNEPAPKTSKRTTKKADAGDSAATE